LHGHGGGAVESSEKHPAGGLIWRVGRHRFGG
jgi:hypothetical protein